MKKDNLYIYENKKDHRIRAYYKDSNGKLCTKSYPRILMEEKLGRPLKPYEDVHHIDGNPLNNSLSNLEIKIHGIHQKEHNPKKYKPKKTQMHYLRQQVYMDGSSTKKLQQVVEEGC